MFSDSKQVVQNLRQGALTPLSAITATAAPDTLVTLFVCPDCDDESPVDVKVERVTVNSNGSPTKKQLSLLTYPAGSLSPLLAACQRPEPLPVVTPVPQPTAGDAPQET